MPWFLLKIMSGTMPWPGQRHGIDSDGGGLGQARLIQCASGYQTPSMVGWRMVPNPVRAAIRFASDGEDKRKRPLNSFYVFNCFLVLAMWISSLALSAMVISDRVRKRTMFHCKVANRSGG